MKVYYSIVYLKSAHIWIKKVLGTNSVAMHGVSPSYVKSCVAGLQAYDHHHTQIQKRTSLIDAYWIARRIEASKPFRKGNAHHRSTRTTIFQKTVPCTRTTTLRLHHYLLPLHQNSSLKHLLSKVTNALDAEINGS
jgi:hypothetical protein